MSKSLLTDNIQPRLSNVQLFQTWSI